MNLWSSTANAGHAVGPECQATPKLLKMSVLLGIPVSFPEKRLVGPQGCAEPGPGSPDPASGERGTRSRERARSPSQPHTADIPNSQESPVLHLCLEAQSGCFGAVDFTRWMPSLCWDNNHFVKAALCSATKAGIVHWIPELVRIFDVATLGLAPPQGICASLW